MDWARQAEGESRCNDCKPGAMTSTRLTFGKKDGLWGVQEGTKEPKKTWPSKRDHKKRKGEAAKRSRRH